MRLATKPPAKRYAKEIVAKAKPDQFTSGEISTVEGLWWGRLSHYNPDDLVGKKGLQIYNKMLKDEQVKAALHAKMMAVISSGHDVLPPEVPEGDKEMADETADFMTFNFEEMEGSIDSKLLEMMSAMPYGFAVGEKVLRLIDYGDYDGKVGLKALKFRKPWSIDFDQDTYGNLLPDGILQAEKRLPADKFVRCVYQKTWDNPYGDSDLRVCYRPWWSKDVIMKYMAIALERFGEPIADISHTGTITPPQRADLQAFGRNLQSRSVLIHPDNITLDFHYPSPRTSEAFIPAIKLYDSQISRGILMPALLGMSGEQAAGSFARSGTEFDVFLWIIAYLRGWIETTVNEQIVKPLIDLNYEVTGGMYPAFRFRAMTEETKQKTFDNWLKAIQVKAFENRLEDENKLREAIHLNPLSQEEWDVLEAQKKLQQGSQLDYRIYRIQTAVNMGLPISTEYLYQLFEIPPPATDAALLRPKLEGQPGEGETPGAQAEGGFLFQDKDGHTYERSFDAEAELIEFVRGLKDVA